MRFRKISVLFLTVVLLLGCIGCGEKPVSPQVSLSPEPAETAAPQPSVEPTAMPSAEPSPAAAPEPSEEPTAAPSAEPEDFVFTEENFPTINGSTSTLPLGEAIMEKLLGISREEAEERLNFSRTTQSYIDLIDGAADLLISGECSEEVYTYKEQQGFEWLRTPFSTEAFVFVVNAGNPVDSITVEEARRIYAGEITNWAELGGKDTPIIPFQRNEEAGSQALMKKHVMQGTAMMEPESGWVVGTMGGLMEAVKSYDNSAGAIGYSVYYYAAEMQMAEGLKLLKLEGVEPCPETIRSGEYPILNPTYVVIDSALPDDAPARRLYDWLLSEAGQRLVAAEGYVSIMDFETESRTPEAVGEIGGRWEGDWNGLQPLTGCGLVSKYAGTRLAASDDWTVQDGCLYGLMTNEGKVLTPPVYSSIDYIYNYSGVEQTLPVLLLRAAEGGDLTDSGFRSYENAYTVAGADLSWVYPESVSEVLYGTDGLILVQDEELVWLSPAGEILNRWNYEESGISEYKSDLFIESGYRDTAAGTMIGGYMILFFDYSSNDIRALQLKTGAVVTLTVEEWNTMNDALPQDYYSVLTRDDRGCTLQRGEEILQLPFVPKSNYIYRYGDVFHDSSRLFTLSGEPLIPESDKRLSVFCLRDCSGSVCIAVRQEQETQFTFYRGDGSRTGLTSGDSEYSAYSYMGGILGIVEEQSASYYRLDTEECIFRISFNYWGED